MDTEPGNEKGNQLQDNVILIINGLSESGNVLAKMLAQQGADVAVIDFNHVPALARRIQQDVEENGRRCLVLTPNPLKRDQKTFAQQAIQIIIDDLGRLDAFITYSAADSGTNEHQSVSDRNGRSSQPNLFDQHNLTRTALRQILAE